MKKRAQLAIVDWGIGGIGILKLIKSRMGPVPVIYFSDTGARPYGKMSRAELVARLNNVISFMQAQGVTHLVFGCNAASTAISGLDQRELKVVGMIESGVRSTVRQHPARLALIGGSRTVRSGAYRRALGERGLEVAQRIAQPLSALIESGDLDSVELRRQCQRILDPIRNHSHILIACTHYPAIKPILQEYVSIQTVFIDPAAALVDQIQGWELAWTGSDSFLTSGNPEDMKKAALKAFDFKIKKARPVTIP